MIRALTRLASDVHETGEQGHDTRIVILQLLHGFRNLILLRRNEIQITDELHDAIRAHRLSVEHICDACQHSGLSTGTAERLLDILYRATDISEERQTLFSLCGAGQSSALKQEMHYLSHHRHRHRHTFRSACVYQSMTGCRGAGHVIDHLVEDDRQFKRLSVGALTGCHFEDVPSVVDAADGMLQDVARLQH